MPVTPNNFGLQGFAFPVANDYPIPYDVRSGTSYDYGMMVGTLTLPAESDVRTGVTYGGDGTEFTGAFGGGGTTPDGPHSPADVIRYLLISLGLAGNPPATPWPAFTASEPATPDNCITTFDTSGRDDGRIQIDGTRIENQGVQIRIRSLTHSSGYAKAREIAESFDIGVYDETVTIGSSYYLVHCITRTSTVLAIGKDVSNSKRSIFTINCLISYKQLD